VSEHKHTPGPWRVAQSDTPCIKNIEGPSFTIRCVMLATDLDEGDYRRRLADLELIARAPDLLAENERLREAPPPAIVEALEVLLAHDVDYMRRNNLGDPESQQRIKHARAALNAWYGRDDA
jgi:hypothetical protein